MSGGDSMDWQTLMAMLDDAQNAIAAKGMADHRPGEADNEDGGTYCYGCEVGALAQSLTDAIEDYVNARPEETA